MGGLCGFPVVEDQSCPNRGNHRDVVAALLSDSESPITDAMVDAAFEYLADAGIGQADLIGYDHMRNAIEAALAERDRQASRDGFTPEPEEVQQ